MNRKALACSLSATIAAIVAALFISMCSEAPDGTVGRGNPAPQDRAALGEAVQADQTDNAGTPDPVHALSPLAQQIADAELLLAQGGDAQLILADLRDQLTAAGASAASRAILEYLASGRDCATGLPFKVGPNGAMLSTPTMRTFLLDLIASVDPQAALDYAETVFEAKDSADEYAICLRNIGRIDTSDAARAYIGKRASELFADASLAAKPTNGFAEAFDALAYAGDADSIAILCRYLEKGRGEALNFPAYVALDRLVIDNTESALRTILETSSQLDDSPYARAGCFARADLASESQFDIVATYVLELDAGGEEAGYFFDLLPNLNYMLVDGLLNDRLSITNEYVVERVEAALEALEAWESDPRFESHSARISGAISRIREFRGE